MNEVCRNEIPFQMHMAKVYGMYNLLIVEIYARTVIENEMSCTYVDTFHPNDFSYISCSKEYDPFPGFPARLDRQPPRVMMGGGFEKSAFKKDNSVTPSPPS